MRLFMIFFALVVAVASGLAFWYMNSGNDSVVAEVPGVQQVQVEETSIIVARRDIPVGHKITEEDLDQQTWPQSLVLPDFVLAGSQAELIDRIARTPFKERQPIARSFVANPNDPGFIAAQLPAGKRAVTIPIDDVSGVSGFIFPGDHVDVIVKHKVGLNRKFEQGESAELMSLRKRYDPNYEIPQVDYSQHLPLFTKYDIPTLMSVDMQGKQPTLNVTEVLVSNVRVLAVGTLISLQSQENQGAPTTITVEVSELDAQKIRHSEQGSLTLALRSLDDVEEKAIPRPVGDSDMSRLTPPSYFPNLYDNRDYKTQGLSVEEVQYSEEADKTAVPLPKVVTVIRGVTKEETTVQQNPDDLILQSPQQANPIRPGQEGVTRP